MITIGKPYVEERGVSTYLICKIIDNGNKFDIWFSVEQKYGKYLCHERCDAFLIGMLQYAMRSQQDITCAGPITEELLFGINTQLLPALTNNSRIMYFTKITAPTISEPADPLERFAGVGTGCSCGVDSFHAIASNLNTEFESMRITHLTLLNVGAFNDTYSEAGQDDVKQAVINRATAVAKEVNLPLVLTNSNYGEVIDQHHLFTNSFANLFGVFCLQKLWKTYYLGSSDGYQYFSLTDNDAYDSAKYDLLTLAAVSTPSLKFYSDGGPFTRIEKTAAILNFTPAQKHLHVCVKESYNDGTCFKCIRTIMALDALESLDKFRKVFDVDAYIRKRPAYFEALYQEHMSGVRSYNEATYQKLKPRIRTQFATAGMAFEDYEPAYVKLPNEIKELSMPGKHRVGDKYYFVQNNGELAAPGWIVSGNDKYYCLID